MSHNEPCSLSFSLALHCQQANYWYEILRYPLSSRIVLQTDLDAFYAQHNIYGELEVYNEAGVQDVWHCNFPIATAIVSAIWQHIFAMSKPQTKKNWRMMLHNASSWFIRSMVRSVTNSFCIVHCSCGCKLPVNVDVLNLPMWECGPPHRSVAFTPTQLY